jgi:hypothetical protein
MSLNWPKRQDPVLNADEASALLDSIDISMLTGLRDRALIARRTQKQRINCLQDRLKLLAVPNFHPPP